MDSQLKYLNEVTETIKEFKNELPEAFAARDAFNDKVYEDGALSAKVKRLMAMSIAVKAGCPGCINYQTKLAVEAGATKGEVVEAASVAASMGGTSAGAWIWIVVQMMKELGKW
jgi:AhpD family alkylhydroperoxidase